MLRCLLSAVLLTAAVNVQAETADATAIAGLLHGMFDKPGATLGVSPVVVAGDHAIADWVQGDIGGRALLRRQQQRWTIVLCAGDAIKTREGLAQAGIAADAAARLSEDLAAAEAKLSPEQRAMFSRFEGLVRVNDASHHHAPDASSRPP